LPSAQGPRRLDRASCGHSGRFFRRVALKELAE
jgi:hypothetical protein